MKQPLKYTPEEAAFNKAARAVAPEEWLARVERVKELRGLEVAVCVASLIWWDFFGKHNWPHLRKFTNDWTPEMEPDPKELEAALVDCGYPPLVAARRVLDDPDIYAKKKDCADTPP